MVIRMILLVTEELESGVWPIWYVSPAGERLDFPAAGRCTVVRVSEPAELYTIGQVARRVGVPARTIRFWCDAGWKPSPTNG